MKTDFELQKDVMEELKWERFLNSTEIGVAVKNGIVTLSGSVDNYSKKRIAEKAALSVAGVKAVAEDIVVKVGKNNRKDDTEIAEAVINSLKWNSAVQEDKIKVKVEDGWVTFENVLTEKINATYENEILKLSLQKKEIESAKQKKEIKVS
jgi:osmotically-inducible protein OsmY